MTKPDVIKAAFHKRNCNCEGHPFNCYHHPYACGCNEQNVDKPKTDQQKYNRIQAKYNASVFEKEVWNKAIEAAIQLCRVYDRGFSTDAGIIRLKLGELKR